jgi:hypothetical protein
LYNIISKFEHSSSITKLRDIDPDIPGRKYTPIRDPDSSYFIGEDLGTPSLTQRISTAIHHIIDACGDLDKEFGTRELRETVIERLRKDHPMLSLRTEEFQRSFQRAIRNVFYTSYELSRDERICTLAMVRKRKFPKFTIERYPEPSIRE